MRFPHGKLMIPGELLAFTTIAVIIEFTSMSTGICIIEKSSETHKEKKKIEYMLEN